MVKNKTSSLALGALFLCLIVVTAQASGPSHISVASNDVTTGAPIEMLTDLRPRQLSIPSISLNREIIDIGVTELGNLDVPPNYTQVGWYKDGTLPGNTGSAVLDGHVDNGAAIPGPFKLLREVKVGDDIFVTAADDTELHFKVTESSVYPTNQFPGELVFNDPSGKLLKIITCHGTFVKSLDTYDQRLIVTAELVE